MNKDDERDWKSDAMAYRAALESILANRDGQVVHAAALRRAQDVLHVLLTPERD